MVKTNATRKAGKPTDSLPSQFGKQRRERKVKKGKSSGGGKLYKIHGSKSERKLDILLKFEVAAVAAAQYYYYNNNLLNFPARKRGENLIWCGAAMVENVIIS